MKRPLFVTVLAWFLIVSSALCTLAMLATGHNPEMQEIICHIPFPIGIYTYTAAYSGSMLNTLAGTAMLHAKNWGRWLYVAYGTAGIIFNLSVSPNQPMLLYGVVLFACIVYFLFRSRTHFYFQTSGGIGNA
ncbi:MULTISPECIES: hypothetical protein [Neisseria]|uniref:Membrane protein n=1 Tax=Neisseria musculi TaxID=1815583 RepID=A0A7H1MF48_9NEIS|nr:MULTISPECIES: hypothetical protein [Neisseria]MBF0804376.1 hypothetical protein [Neisseria sp. 19428wB4_WF04]QNT60263.1 putative membrane protein [Neisseria musculi]TFU42856.1 hypothetical protein E4T99_08495 [Neisseria sp. WF04]